MINLLDETLEVLKENNKTEEDVKWVGNRSGYSTWENFKDIANVEYDDGFGSAEVAEDLLIVGSNWWLERHEYDGAEEWLFKKMPRKPKVKIKLHNVIGGMWDSLEKLNK